MLRFLSAFDLSAAATCSLAQNFSSSGRSRQRRRAIEAMILGMPVLNYDLMLQEMLLKRRGGSVRSSTGGDRSIGTIKR
jgi:hypothetical protein